MNTYNQIIKRIKDVTQSHRQIRNCYKGLVTDFLANKTTLYPSAFLSDNGSGSISITDKSTSYSFRLYILDLVHLAGDTKLNEQDVFSDCMLIAIDLIAQLSSFIYIDWRFSSDNPTQFVVENENDFIAGVTVDFTIKVIFNRDKCAIPFTNTPIYIDQDTKYVNDMIYISNGGEGNVLNIPEIVGKKLLLLTRESMVQYEVSNNPNTTEFIFDGNTITLGLEVNTEAVPGERFLLLYRNY